MISEAVVLIDATVLDAFYKLGKLHLLNLFPEVLIPQKVVLEFLDDSQSDSDQRHSFIQTALREYAWLRHCDTYDAAIMDMLQAGGEIDPGEIELISQYKSYETFAGRKPIAVLDDAGARKVADRMQINRIGTLAILTRLDGEEYLDYWPSVEYLIEQGCRFSRATAEFVFQATKIDIQEGRSLLL